MASAKSFVKGLAAGAVLGAVAAIVSGVHDKDKKMRSLRAMAVRVKNRVAGHAKTVGKLTKGAYHEIVEKAIAECRGAKTLSEAELDELKDELKGSWTDVRKMIKK